ncbi:MAG: isoprenyl transferase [Bacteroidota bacterium]
MSLTDQLNPNEIPKHIAVIMDGNGRWARKRGNMRVFGHRNAIKAVRDTTEGAAEVGVEYLTLYAFSTENWKRPKAEVDALMTLLVETIAKERSTLMDNNIRLNAIGNLDALPKACVRSLEETMKITADNNRMTLSLALSYGSRSDLKQAIKQIATEVKEGRLQAEDINDTTIKQFLSTSEIPDPELLIRTSGEHRISNFLLWEIAYTEIYFTSKLWPDFRREDLFEAIQNYQQRERRFGLISEQIK